MTNFENSTVASIEKHQFFWLKQGEALLTLAILNFEDKKAAARTRSESSSHFHFLSSPRCDLLLSYTIYYFIALLYGFDSVSTLS